MARAAVAQHKRLKTLTEKLHEKGATLAQQLRLLSVQLHQKNAEVQNANEERDCVCKNMQKQKDIEKIHLAQLESRDCEIATQRGLMEKMAEEYTAKIQKVEDKLAWQKNRSQKIFTEKTEAILVADKFAQKIANLKGRLASAKMKIGMCTVCLDSEQLLVNFPCGHACACQRCTDASLENACFVCRTHVSRRVRLYLASEH